MSDSQTTDQTDTSGQQPGVGGPYSFGSGVNPAAFMLPGMYPGTGMYPGMGYGGGGQIQDPLMYGPQMQQMWARGLLGQAADASPVRSPWQAAARAVSGLLGGYEARSATQQMNQILGQQQAAAHSSLGDVQRIMSGLGTQGAPAAGNVPQPSAAPGKGTGVEQPANAQDMAALPDVKALPADIQGPLVNAMVNRGLGVNGAAQYARMIMAESSGQHMGPSGNQVLRSPAGALGAAQVMPATFSDMAKKYNITGDITDLNANLNAGAAYFKEGLDASNGDLAGGAVYYNAGPGGLASYQAGKGIPAETQAYLTNTRAQGPAVTAASNVTIDPSTGAATIGGGSGMQTAIALREKALQMSMSMNPFERAAAPQVMAQAAAVANLGAYRTQVRPDGTIINKNVNTGQETVTGTARQLTKDSADNLVDNQGNIIVPHGQYTVMSSNFGPGGNQLLVQDPSGKLATVGEPGRPEQTLRDDFTRLMAQWSADPSKMSAADRIKFGNTIQQLYPTKTEFIPGTNTPRVIQPVSPPPGTPSLDELTGAKPPTAPATGAPALPAQTETQVKAESTLFDKRVDAANTYVTNLQTQADATRTIAGDTQAIRDLVSQIRTGWGAETQARARNFLTSIGAADPSQLDKVTDAQAAEKMFLKLSFDAVRNLGAREPGSVISMTMQRFPNLESTPGAIEIMTRMLDLQQRYHEERINAVNNWLSDQTSNATASGHRFSEFKGIGDFANSGWDKTHDPRAYAAAALAAAGQPEKVYMMGLPKEQKPFVEQLVTNQYPGEWGSRP